MHIFKILLASCALQVAAGGQLGNEVHDQLTKGKIVPDVVAHLPEEVLSIGVTYTEVEVENGVLIPVPDTQSRPHVELRGKGFGGAEDQWTLLMVDPDAPSPEEPVARNVLHWMVVNIPGSTASSQEIWETGKVVAEYMEPEPPIGTHRYVFLAFKQEGDLDVGEPADRAPFDVNAFAKEYGLGYAQGGVYFVAKHVDELNSGSWQSQNWQEGRLFSLQPQDHPVEGQAEGFRDRPSVLL